MYDLLHNLSHLLFWQSGTVLRATPRHHRGPTGLHRPETTLVSPPEPTSAVAMEHAQSTHAVISARPPMPRTPHTVHHHSGEAMAISERQPPDCLPQLGTRHTHCPRAPPPHPVAHPSTRTSHADRNAEAEGAPRYGQQARDGAKRRPDRAPFQLPRIRLMPRHPMLESIKHPPIRQTHPKLSQTNSVSLLLAS